MASEDEGRSALGALSRNWRSALVVNSLHDALEETEKQRDELAQRLRYLDTTLYYINIILKNLIPGRALIILKLILQSSTVYDS